MKPSSNMRQTVHTPAGFLLPREKRVRYGLLFDCEWNIDDGLGIRYDRNIAEIGTSDVVL
uniref:DUF6985 domain-containing protein n=1 Tax=Enterocloster clostridioformis TaxID=1531 RepID=UPI003FA44069